MLICFSMSIFQENLLKDRVAFVTGGGSGIGQRMAERFAEHSAKVVLAGRKQEKLDAAASAIRAPAELPRPLRWMSATTRRLPRRCARRHERFGEIDILLCAAAGNFPAPVTGCPPNGFKAVIDIDLLGTFNTCRAAYEFLRKPGASVISISASHATTPIAAQAHVCAAKAGVELLMKTLAIEWGRQGIRANCITPGPNRRYRRHASARAHRRGAPRAWRRAFRCDGMAPKTNSPTWRCSCVPRRRRISLARVYCCDGGTLADTLSTPMRLA